MVLRMARPWKHPKSGVYYIRERVPREMAAKARGRRIAFPAEAGSGSVTVRANTEHVKASLRTRDPREAKERHAAAQAHLKKVLSAVRAGPKPLTRKQIVALAGLAYRAFAEGGEDDPGPARVWEQVRIMNREAATAKYGTASLRIFPNDTTRRAATMEARYGAFADGLLEGQGVITDDASRRALIEELHRALTEAAEKLQRNAEGDFSPDAVVQRFPAWERPREQTATGATISGLLEGWTTEAKANHLSSKTIKGYTSLLNRFRSFLKHNDASRVKEQDILQWKDARIAAGKTLKTIADADMAAFKSVFGWGQANRRIPTNPAAKISIKLGRKILERSSSFTEKEAIAILNAAQGYVRADKELDVTASAKRWVPWLAAYTGARVGELAQLRKQDVRRSGDTWLITITPEAGTVKNKRPREVVLHNHLVELGFPAFAQASKGPYLFLTAHTKQEALGRLNALKNRLADFARAIVPDKRVQPNHGWRHRFKTIGREAGIDERILDGIQGHAPANVGAGYGEVTPKAQAAALARFPRYRVSLSQRNPSADGPKPDHRSHSP